MDAKDILGLPKSFPVTQEKKSRPQKEPQRKPDGISREAYSLTGGMAPLMPTVEKLPSPGLSRPTSSSSPNPLPPSQSAQSLQQQWMSNQLKQSHGTSFPSSYRPQMKPHMAQQRPQSLHQHQPSVSPNQLQISSSQQQQVQQQMQLQQHSLQQHQQPQQKQNLSISNELQELHGHRNNLSPQQLLLQGARAHGSVSQTTNSSFSQPVMVHSATTIPTMPSNAESRQILSKRSIQELVAQINPHEKLDPEVEDVLIEIADDFVESITLAACSMAKHRKSTVLEAKDILLYVERHWNMTLPGFGGDEIKCYKKPFSNDIHKERLAVIRKSTATASDVGNTKNAPSGQVAAALKVHSSKTPATASSSPKET
ncbi:hypothetical protein HPP92_024099 [Vanilla planifolia]|uniref:Transcription initiation factor TFIID subunit 12 domain-containing protein n=1 Tax=Vanilla planifolia TaxID=51239 RepID=A0A835UED4_VANPL|nr:hypothetical protein HPP92_024099 [Vanilla planifolia]